jgi:hypothetical protein
MQPFVSDDIALGADERRQLPQISMAIAGATTEVKVVLTPAGVAEEQVKAAEHQRVLGIIPYFYSSYIWAAEPLDARQKFDLAFHSLTDPIEFVGTGIIAGAGQATDTFPGYGQGAGGFAKRYGAAYADEVSGKIIGSAILPSLIHQIHGISTRDRAAFLRARSMPYRERWLHGETAGRLNQTTHVYLGALQRVAWQIFTILARIAAWA